MTLKYLFSLNWLQGLLALPILFTTISASSQNRVPPVQIASFEDIEIGPIKLMYDPNNALELTEEKNRRLLREYVNTHYNDTSKLSPRQQAKLIQSRCMAKKSKSGGDFLGEFTEEMIGDNLGFLIASWISREASRQNPGSVEEQVSNSLLSPYSYGMIATAILVQQGFTAGAKILRWLPDELCNYHMTKIRGQKVLVNRPSLVQSILQKTHIISGLGMGAGASVGQLIVDILRDKELHMCLPSTNSDKQAQNKPSPEQRRKSCIVAMDRWNSPQKTADIVSMITSYTISGTFMYSGLKIVADQAKNGKAVAKKAFKDLAGSAKEFAEVCTSVSKNSSPDIERALLAAASRESNFFAGSLQNFKKQSISDCAEFLREFRKAKEPIILTVKKPLTLLRGNPALIVKAHQTGKYIVTAAKVVGAAVGGTAAAIAKNPWMGRISLELASTLVFFVGYEIIDGPVNNFFQPIFRENGHEKILAEISDKIADLANLADNSNSSAYLAGTQKTYVSSGSYTGGPASFMGTPHSYNFTRGLDPAKTLERKIERYSNWNSLWRDHLMKDINIVYQGYSTSFDATLQQWASAKSFYSTLVYRGENLDYAKLPDSFGFLTGKYSDLNCEQKDLNLLSEDQRFYCAAKAQAKYLAANKELLTSKIWEIDQIVKSYQSQRKVLAEIVQLLKSGEPSEELQAQTESYKLQADIIAKVAENMALVKNAFCYLRQPGSNSSICGNYSVVTTADRKELNSRIPTFATVWSTAIPNASHDSEAHNTIILLRIFKKLADEMALANDTDTLNITTSYLPPPINYPLGLVQGVQGDQADPTPEQLIEAQAYQNLLAGNETTLFGKKVKYPKTYEYNLFVYNPYYKLIQSFGYPFRLRMPFYLAEAMMIDGNPSMLSTEIYKKDSDFTNSGAPWNTVNTLFDYYTTSVFCGTKLDWFNLKLPEDQKEKLRSKLMDDKYLPFLPDWGPGGGQRAFRPPKMMDSQVLVGRNIHETIYKNDLCQTFSLHAKNGKYTNEEWHNPRTKTPAIPNPSELILFKPWGQTLTEQQYMNEGLGVPHIYVDESRFDPLFRTRNLIYSPNTKRFFFDNADAIMKSVPTGLIKYPEYFERIWSDIVNQPMTKYLLDKNDTYFAELKKLLDEKDPIWTDANTVESLYSSGIKNPSSEKRMGLYSATYEQMHNLSLVLREMFSNLAANSSGNRIKLSSGDLIVTAGDNKLSTKICSALETNKIGLSANETFENLIKYQLCVIQELAQFMNKPRLAAEPRVEKNFGQIVQDNIKYILNELVNRPSETVQLLNQAIDDLSHTNEFKDPDTKKTNLRDMINGFREIAPELLMKIENTNYDVALLGNPTKYYYSIALFSINYKMYKNLIDLQNLMDAMIANTSFDSTNKALYRSVIYSVLKAMAYGYHDLHKRDQSFNAIFQERHTMETNLGVVKSLPWEDADDEGSEEFAFMYAMSQTIDSIIYRKGLDGINLSCEELGLRAQFYDGDLDPFLTEKICGQNAQ